MVRHIRKFTKIIAIIVTSFVVTWTTSLFFNAKNSYALTTNNIITTEEQGETGKPKYEYKIIKTKVITEELFNKYGDDGWELIYVDLIASHCCILKRKIMEKPINVNKKN